MKRKGKFGFLVFAISTIFFCISFFGVQAQTNYSFTNITQGLPSLQTYSVVQDDDGFIWVATDRGICRYDGKEFKVFGVKDGLNDPVVFKLVNVGGILWFQSNLGDFGRIVNHKIEIIRNYKTSNFRLQEIYGFEDHVINTWVRDSVICYDVYNTEGVLILSDSSNKKPLLKSIEGNKRIIVGNTKLLLGEIEIDGKYKGHYKFDQCAGRHLAVNSDGKSIYFSKGQKLVKIDSLGSHSTELDDDATTGSLIDNKKNYWICTYSGLIQFTGGDLNQRRTFLKENKVSGIFQDTEGNFWVATLHEGIYYVKPTKLETLERGRIELIKSSDNSITALRNRQEFITIDPRGVSYLKVDEDVQDYTCLNKRIWFTYRGKEGAKINTNGLISIQETGSKILKSRNDSIWIIRGNQIILKTKKGFMRSAVKSIGGKKPICFVSPNDSLTFIANTVGIFKIEYTNFLNAKITQVSPISLKSIAVSKNYGYGCVKGVGLLVFDSNWNPIDTLNIESGISSLFISKTISLHGSDTLLVAGSEGLDIITYNNRKVKLIGRFSKRDGLLSNEIFDIHIFNNHLYIASSKGLQKIGMNDVFTRSMEKEVILNLLSVNGIHTLNKKYIELSPENKTMVFNFYGLSYSNTNSALLEYRIPEIDVTWKTTNLNEVEFANMSPGDYHFEFRVKGKSEVKTLKFKLEAAFYETKTFKATIAFVLLFGMLYLWYLRTQNKYKRLSNKMENERLRQSALVARLNPHFLFNTLGGLQTLVMQKETMKAVNYISGFSELMRHILKRSGERYTGLFDEIQFIDAFIDLENLKNGIDTRIKWDLDQKISINDFWIPSMFLQPIVENSVKHGMLGFRKDGTIDIRFSIVSKNTVEITIEDNGKGFQPKIKTQNDRTHASDIILKRIQLMQDSYNKNYKIEIINLRDTLPEKTGTRVILKLPYDTAKN